MGGRRGQGSAGKEVSCERGGQGSAGKEVSCGRGQGSAVMGGRR